VQVAATTPRAAWRLITILVSVCLHLDGYVAKVRQFEDILGLLSPGEGYEEKWKVK
jgi:hypothetical protein